MSIFTKEEFDAYTETVSTSGQYDVGHAHSKEFIEKYTSATLETETVTGEEHYGENFVPLDVLPAQSITKVVDEDGLDVPITYGLSRAKLAVLFYPENRPRIPEDPRRYHDYWYGYEMPRRVFIDYIAGYTTVPAPLKRAALEIAKQRVYKTDTPDQSVMSLSSEGVNLNFALASWQEGKPTATDWVDSILNAYQVRTV